MLRTMSWRYLEEIDGLLLMILGIVSGGAILQWYARQNIVLPEQFYLYIPEYIGLIYCFWIFISGIVLLGGWVWRGLPSMKVLLIFTVINGIMAIGFGYLYGYSKTPAPTPGFAGETDLESATALTIVGIAIVTFTCLFTLIRNYSDLKDKSINKTVILAVVFAIFCILLTGFVFPLFFDSVARNFPDHNLKVAVRQNVDKKFGFVTSSDLEKMAVFNANPEMNVFYSSPGSTEPAWTSLGPNVRTTVLSMEDNEIGNLQGIGQCANLETLDLGFNPWLQDIAPLKDLHRLTKLTLNGDVKDLTPLSGVTGLTYLDLWGNDNLQDIKPLENLTKLSVFIAFGCSIQDVSSLRGLTNLNWLDLGDNKIVDISPLIQNTGLGEGDEVDLRYNPLNDVSVSVYIPQLRERGVEVQWKPSRRN